MNIPIFGRGTDGLLRGRLVAVLPFQNEEELVPPDHVLIGVVFALQHIDLLSVSGLNRPLVKAFLGGGCFGLAVAEAGTGFCVDFVADTCFWADFWADTCFWAGFGC